MIWGFKSELWVNISSIGLMVIFTGVRSEGEKELRKDCINRSIIIKIRWDFMIEFNFKNRQDLVVMAVIILILIATIFVIISQKNLSENFLSILSFLLVLLSFSIAYDTYKLNRNNHRLALFDKRYKIYTALMSVLNTIGIEGEVSNENFKEFHKQKMEARFLFNNDILKYLDEIERNMNDLLYYQKKEKSNENYSDKVNWLQNYFTNEMLTCTDKFVQYLSFREI